MKVILSLFALLATYAAAADPENKGRARFRGLQDGSGDAGGGCFSGENMVEVKDVGLVRMDALKIGEYVRVGGKEFARVYSFLHYHEEMEYEYLQINAKDINKPLEVTANHLLFVEQDGVTKTIPAEKVKAGDMIVAENGTPTQVVEIGNVKRRGVYAPLTTTGDVVVNGLLASSYVGIYDEDKAGLPISTHTWTHAFFTPRRMLCGMNFGWCENETYTPFGLPTWSGESLLLWFYYQSFVFQVAATALLTPILFVFALLEKVFASGVLLNLVLLGCVLVFNKKTKKSKTLKK